MESRSTLVLLGALTLFLGGVVGGVVGSALIARTTAAGGPVTAGPSAEPGTSDPQLVRAIQELVDEVRRARNVPPTGVGAAERRVAGEESQPALDEDRVVAALDRLTDALKLAQGRASPGGIGITPLVLPQRGSRIAALQDLAGRDWEDISREFRFWTFQQVLDRFGRPDEVDNDRWIYFLPTGDDQEVFTFQFSQGYLMNIYD